jgi:alanyl-tRNA synthetase
MLDNNQDLQKVLYTKLLELTSKLPSKIVNNIPLFHIDFNVDIKIINKMLSVFPQDSLLIVDMGDNKIRLLSMSGKIDANEILQKLITKYKGKGGGNPKSAQAVLEKIPENLIYEIEQTLISYD